MEDKEYAARIYCQVFKAETDGGDAYTRGILSAIDTLDQPEQLALASRFRFDKTLEQTGIDIGVSANRAGQIVEKALRKLRHKSRSRKMSVARMIEDKDKQLEDANATIAELYDQIVQLLQGKPLDSKIKSALVANKVNIDELNFSSGIHNRLVISGVSTAESLIALDSPDMLTDIHGIGIISRNEIITKTREWVERMEKETLMGGENQ